MYNRLYAFLYISETIPRYFCFRSLIILVRFINENLPLSLLQIGYILFLPFLYASPLHSCEQYLQVCYKIFPVDYLKKIINLSSHHLLFIAFRLTIGYNLTILNLFLNSASYGTNMPIHIALLLGS